MNKEWEPKILGIMQSAADKTLQISFVGNKVTITGKTLSEPAEFTRDVFGQLTVHDILDQAGVEIDANAGQ